MQPIQRRFRKQNVMIAGAIALVFGAFSVSANAAIVVDGAFNNPSLVSGFTDYTSGQAFGGPTNNAWTVGSGSVDLVGTHWQGGSGAGSGSVDLDGNAPGSISQTLNSLTVGQTYKLTFDLSGNPDGAPGANPVKSMDVSVGNQSGIAYSFDTATKHNTDTNMKYVEETLIFTATGTSDTLTFASTDTSGAYGAVIGDVKVTPSAVPEPPALVSSLLGFGLIAFLAVRRRRDDGMGTAAF